MKNFLITFTVSIVLIILNIIPLVRCRVRVFFVLYVCLCLVLICWCFNFQCCILLFFVFTSFALNTQIWECKLHLISIYLFIFFTHIWQFNFIPILQFNQKNFNFFFFQLENLWIYQLLLMFDLLFCCVLVISKLFWFHSPGGSGG